MTDSIAYQQLNITMKYKKSQYIFWKNNQKNIETVRKSRLMSNDVEKQKFVERLSLVKSKIK